MLSIRLAMAAARLNAASSMLPNRLSKKLACAHNVDGKMKLDRKLLLENKFIVAFV